MNPDTLEEVDPASSKSLPELLRMMGGAAFGARELGLAFETLAAMVRDDDCRVVMTISGAMSVAKMSRVLSEQIERGWVDTIVTTGAFVTHALASALGGTHLRWDGATGDSDLREAGLNRVYEVLESDTSLVAIESLVDEVTATLSGRETGSRGIVQELGHALARRGLTGSPLERAARCGVPIYIPALTDSELGLDIAMAGMSRSVAAGGPAGPADLVRSIPGYNPFRDLAEFVLQLSGAKRLGVLTIGGGVPRNWAQQLPPYVRALERRFGWRLDIPRYSYGVRICPEPDFLGGLSGCTYTEGVSWGKFVPAEEGGRFAEVHCDATIAWPLLVRALIEELGGGPTRG